MPNTVLNPSIIAKTAVRVLENELVMGSRVYRGYEEEFDKKVNGYDIGDTISIRKPQQFTVRQTAVAVLQDIQEGKLSLVVNQQKGVDFSFSSAELTLKISELADRIIRPAMVRLANQIDQDIMAEYYRIPNWVGQPAVGADAPISSFAMFARGAERLDQMAVPQDQRSAVLAPDSYWAMATSQTGLFLNQVGQQAYRQGEIGEVGGVATYMSQNVPTYVGTTANDDAAVVAAAGGAGVLSTTYAAVMNTEATPGTMSINTSGWGTTDVIRAGTVFTLGTGGTAVLAVNPVTKQVLPFQQMFTVLADVTAAAGAATLLITPPIIAASTAAAADLAWVTTNIPAAAGVTLQVVGGDSLSYRQNLMFHKNAFALVVVPMVKPPGAVEVARETYKGISARLIPYYDGVNDVSKYRLDVLYGVKTVDNRMAVRLSGGASTLGNPAQ
jgi:P22 coat protein - gene protein 5